MYCLFLDLSFEVGAVALLKGEELVATIQKPSREFHSILYDIETLLVPLNLTINDIGCYALATGPGSYTGLRNAASVIKTLSYVESKPIIEVSSLFLFIPQSHPQGASCAVVADAKIGGLYLQRFQSISQQFGQLLVDENSPALFSHSLDEFNRSIEEVNILYTVLSIEELEKKFSAGKGCEEPRVQELGARLKEKLVFVDPLEPTRGLYFLPSYISHKIQNGAGVQWNNVTLNYLRKTQAEIERRL